MSQANEKQTLRKVIKKGRFISDNSNPNPKPKKRMNL